MKREMKGEKEAGDLPYRRPFVLVVAFTSPGNACNNEMWPPIRRGIQAVFPLRFHSARLGVAEWKRETRGPAEVPGRWMGGRIRC